ncbi:BRO1-domain-containing protein [Aulographum hederae CBS 113979]|uniref:BRO1-domain-containing protein n=1 Tax=Aulographum hederae CBS 113979 TaxID=1176131 RepID=A0A6G1H072_9PEZI|nr:BRO1-domain-containing protein [Aulographum hederae CBS 113979]
MSSNILVLPFRHTTNVSLSDAIKQYISTRYDQHPDMFAKDLEAIDQLRTAAIHSLEPHVSGVKKIQVYAAQLVWIGGKFPIDIGVDFSWYPALGYNTSRPTSQNNIRFELANILYNLAAMYSQLAMSSNRSTPEGLKTASNYFCLCAGVLSYLRTDVVPEMRSAPPEDMDTMTLECLEQLFLAQAQECFWQKAVKDGMKDAIIAKLATKVSDYYSDASDWGVKSDTITSEWIHHMGAKHHHFAAAAQYRAACDCLEKRKYGEEVARLKDSLVCVNEALKEARYINKAVLNDLNGLKNKVQDDLKRAEKDNDMIYLIPVPPKPELKTLDRANMVKIRVPEEVSNSNAMLGENGELGRPLFSKLVPYSVHVAASIYADRRDRLVNQSIIDELEAMTGKIHDILTSLNLPGSLQALEKPLGLPPGIMSHAEEIRQQDGINKLYRSIEETQKLKRSDRTIYEEGVDLLRSEATEDDRARMKYGTDRWNRPKGEEVLPKLYAQIGETDGYLKTAAASDEKVQEKLRENERYIKLLGGSDRDLEHFVPSSRRVTMTPAVEKEASRLRGCLNEITRLESRRKRKIESLKTKAKQDDINPELLQEAARLEREYPMQKIEAVQFETLFEKRLHKYDVDKTAVSEEEDEQSAIATRLTEANAAFTNARRGDSSTKQREQALQSLENAFVKYKEIISNLDAGRRFYNDLAKIVGRFRDDCRSFAYQRRAEASQVES